MKPTVWSASSRQAKLCTVRTAFRHWKGERSKSGQWQLNHKNPVPSSRRKSWRCRGSALRDRKCIHESSRTAHGCGSETHERLRELYILSQRSMHFTNCAAIREDSYLSREHAYKQVIQHLCTNRTLQHVCTDTIHPVQVLQYRRTWEVADPNGDWTLTTTFSLFEQGWAEATSKNSSHTFLSRADSHKVSSHQTLTSATVLSRHIKHL